MPNLDLDKKEITISDNRVKEYLGKDKISGNHLTTEISRLKSSLKETPNEEKQYVLNYLEGKVKTQRNAIDAPKRARMNIDAQGTKKSITGDMNNFKKGTSKDGINLTRVKGDAKLTGKGLDGKTNQASKINDSNRITYYESYESEIEAVRYLIEYMNNNNNKNKIL
jgi:hypothetical protein